MYFWNIGVSQKRFILLLNFLVNLFSARRQHLGFKRENFAQLTQDVYKEQSLNKFLYIIKKGGREDKKAKGS